ncbi:MAG: YeeE/YedE family protein [Deltaproteobacteria bacterium]|nr:YeeE/YedE family protein [Deltaproteobacteria bacterium]
MRFVPAFVAGALFGLGLLVSGMTDPANVTAFLNVGGAWDPSLAFVMVGAIGVFAAVYRVIAPRRRSLRGGPLHLPTATHVDGALLGGAAVFGIGWGLAGYCPGPAIVSAASGAAPALVFVVAMIAGMAIAGPRRG